VDVKTIDTDNSSRDEHLRSVSYFNAEEYPVITIKSTKIDKTNKSNAGWYYFTGTLSMHGVIKVISFPFTATPQGSNFLFAAKFELNRLDYVVGESSSVMSKTVKISLSVLAKKI
jgi:polyisoprenoid-binding protein YceI